MKERRVNINRESLQKLKETREGLRRVESFPYSEDLRSVMDADLYSCLPSDPVKPVLKEMAGRGISSAIVVDEQERPVGIITERDVMQRVVAAEDQDIDKTFVSDIMTPDPVSLSPGDTIYRALSVLSAGGIKHLPLVEDGRVAGIVTLRQLFKLRYPEPMSQMESIRSASDLSTLKAIRSKLPAMAESRIREGRRAYDIVVMISLLNQDIHRRIFELALDKVGSPPASLCLYATGSHGRLENLLTPDQDHGMIIADAAGEPQYSDYYIELTVTFSDWLNEVGFENCPGYIMCSNPIWRKSLSEWKEQIRYWFDRQVRELGRFCTVIFDAVPIYGDSSLFEEMSDFAYLTLRKHHEALRVLHEEEGGHQVPTGLFGRFITERNGEHRGELDIKRSGLIFVVEAVRILALLHGIRETATLKRISGLVNSGFIHSEDGEYFEAAYHFLLHLALKTQAEKMINGSHDTFINPSELSRHDREALRHAFKAVSSLQDLVATEFGELVI